MIPLTPARILQQRAWGVISIAVPAGLSALSPISPQAYHQAVHAAAASEAISPLQRHQHALDAQDFGGSWVNLTAKSGGAVSAFWDFDWGAHLHSGKTSPYKDTTILATAYEDRKHMKGLGVGWDEQIHFIRSDDFFASAHKKLASCGNQFEIAGQKVKHLDHEPSLLALQVAQYTMLWGQPA